MIHVVVNNNNPTYGHQPIDQFGEGEVLLSAYGHIYVILDHHKVLCLGTAAEPRWAVYSKENCSALSFRKVKATLTVEVGWLASQ